jgi:hypothetical protein
MPYPRRACGVRKLHDYAETLKAAINQSNGAMGLTRIDPDAEGIFERYS